MNKKGFTECLVNYAQLIRNFISQSEIRPEIKNQSTHFKSNFGYTTTGQLAKKAKSKLCKPAGNE